MPRFSYVCGILAVLAVGTLTEGKTPPEVARGKEPMRRTNAEAEELVRKYLKDERDVVIRGGFTLKELTTDAVWDRLRVQVFQIKRSDTLPNQSTYVVKQDKVMGIGMDFGGDGVNSLCVADLKGDGRPYLVYSFAWGSGIHRSQIGALDCLAKEPKEVFADKAYFGDIGSDWRVRALDKRTVRVEAGGVSFGNLELTHADGKTRLELRLPNDLPADLRRQVK